MNYTTIDPTEAAADVLVGQASAATLDLWRADRELEVHAWCAAIAELHGGEADQAVALDEITARTERLTAVIDACAAHRVVADEPSPATRRAELAATIEAAERDCATQEAMLAVDTDEASRDLRRLIILGAEAAHAVATALLAELPTPEPPRIEPATPETPEENRARRERERTEALARMNAHLP